MGRIRKVFENEKAFIAGGDPDIETTEQLIPKMAEAGADIIEIGIPFSDPIAEGIVIQEAEGFLYCVSSLGVTGVRNKITTDISEMIKQVRKKSDIPCAIGFGIATPKQAYEMAKIADGVIVGSAIVKMIAQYGKKSIEPVCQYTQTMKKAIRNAEIDARIS